ncbi:DNA recombination protein RmuC [Altericroceibacterium spongiae]|uniref:DNA recombination protein RmuC homolog n=1 Tax=Altericroceibacterium spongiae TaxID=2320269 RepID=A0A420EMP1_9SPHN|nr:DNA recombination protein RmuC [Altericroceibacterium spongiae]RKF21911.1 DNA recombination protein RmuC [Altericroceibacterium spongiae]
MDPIVTLIVVLIALGLGAAGGWFAGSRPVAQWESRFRARDQEAREMNEKIARMAPELATMSDRAARADRLSEQLDQAREELTALKTQAAGFEEQKKLLVETRENLLKEFQNTGSRVLGEAQEAFLKRATERFGHAEKSSEEKIRALLHPVGEKLKNYEEQVAQLEAKRVDAFGQLTGLIQSMREGQEQVRAEAARLGNSLRNAPKARGRWGEQQLRNVLEQCGLSEHTDFLLEQSIDTEDGRLRPDAIVNVPGHKKLVIDAKVSLNAYQDAFDADTEEQRDAALAAHAKAMRNHVQTLGTKSYQSQFEDAPDYVVMFVPGEHFVAAALEQDPGLWDFAFKNRVLLATPTNLVAIARTVAQVWRQVGLAEEAKEIGRLGGELYDRLAKISEDLGKMGTHLGRAVSSYNEFTRSFDTRVLVSARKLREKHIEIGKREISDDISLVEGAPLHASLASSSQDAARSLTEGDKDQE